MRIFWMVLIICWFALSIFWQARLVQAGFSPLLGSPDLDSFGIVFMHVIGIIGVILLCVHILFSNDHRRSPTDPADDDPPDPDDDYLSAA